jgi:hypothetical protein
MNFDKFIAMVLKTLKKGRVKYSDDKKVDLTPFINESINNTLISELDAVISKEDVKVDEDDNKCHIVSMLKVKEDTFANRTFVVSVNRKQLVNSFDFLKDTRIGALLRSSTLSSIYYPIKDLWKKLIDSDKSKTYVMYVPKIFVFANLSEMDLYEDSVFTNLLLVVTPTSDDIREANDKEMTKTDIKTHIITDILEAVIKTGNHNVIIDPYSHKVLADDKYESGSLWNDISTSVRVDENIHSIIFDFTFWDEEDFKLFISTAKEDK